MCEYALEVAEDYAKKVYNEKLMKLIFSLTDDIIATVEQIEA